MTSCLFQRFRSGLCGLSLFVAKDQARSVIELIGV